MFIIIMIDGYLIKQEIAIYVIVEDGGYGSDWAAPISTLIIEKYLKNTILI